MSHRLNLFVDQNHFLTTDLIVRDISQYDEDLTVYQPLFQILTPGSDVYQTIAGFNQGGATTVDTYKLGLTAYGKPLENLPDGVYVMNYAVSPHAQVNNTVYHYRTSLLKERILAAMAVVFDIDPVDVDATGNVKLTKQMTSLNFCYMLMQSAAFTADCGYRTEEAYRLYKKAVSILDRMTIKP